MLPCPLTMRAVLDGFDRRLADGGRSDVSVTAGWCGGALLARVHAASGGVRVARICPEDILADGAEAAGFRVAGEMLASLDAEDLSRRSIQAEATGNPQRAKQQADPAECDGVTVSSPLVAGLYRWLCELAEAGAPTPPLIEIARQFGQTSRDWARQALADLVRAELITVGVYTSHTRWVTIVRTGARTAHTAPPVRRPVHQRDLAGQTCDAPGRA